MGVLLILRQGKREVVKDSLAKCSENLNELFKTMMFFPFLGDVKGASEYLKKSSLSFKERLRIQSSFSQTKSVRKEKELFLSLVEKAMKESALDSPSSRHDFLKELEGIELELWKNSLKLLVAIRSKNFPWAIELKRMLAQASPYYTFIRGVGLTEEEKIKIRDYLIFVLKNYKETFSTGEELKVLAERLSQIGQSNEFKVISNELDADWSLNEIRGHFKNPILKSEFFDFWYYVLMNRSSETEVKSRLRQALSKRVLKGAANSQFWVFEFFFPSSQVFRKIILERLESMWSSPDLMDRYTVLRTLENPSVKSNLGKKRDDFKRANFQLQRQFFTSLLQSGYATDYALYRLYRLGDEDMRHLWWIMF